MKDFIKLSKLYFEINFKLYISVLIGSIGLIGLCAYIDSISIDAPLGQILMMMYGVGIVPIIGILSFNKDTINMMFNVSDKRLTQIAIYIIYPAISAMIIVTTYMLLMSHMLIFTFYGNLTVFDVIRMTFVIAFIGATILLVVYILKMEYLSLDQNKKRWAIIIIVFAVYFEAITVVHSSIGTLIISEIELYRVLSSIITFSYIILPLIYAAIRYRKLEL